MVTFVVAAALEQHTGQGKAAVLEGAVAVVVVAGVKPAPRKPGYVAADIQARLGRP